MKPGSSAAFILFALAALVTAAQAQTYSKI